MRKSNGAPRATSPSHALRTPKLFVPAWVRPLLPELKGAPLAVLCCYASLANKEGLAWPSLRFLKVTTGYGINQVKQARTKLVKMGLLVPVEQERSAGRFGRKVFRLSTVAPKQYHGNTVALPTVAPSTVAPWKCQEGSPKERCTGRKGSQKSEDAGLLPTNHARRKRKGNLESRLAAKIAGGEGTWAEFLTFCRSHGGLPDWLPEAWVGFEAVRYKLDEGNPLVSPQFVCGMLHIWQKYKDEGLSPGILATKLLDYCDRHGILWPPDFQEHRDRLRAEEREREAQSG